jgi:hypothetical protein
MNIVLIIIIILAIYVYSYYRYPPKVLILQSLPDQFKADMLLERQPIVIENNASSLKDLKNAFFKWSPTHNFNISGSEKWHYNRYKYIALELENDGEILLCPPKTKMIVDVTNGQDIPDPDDANLLAVQAKKGEIVIIPFHWRYLIDVKLDVACIGIHDFITYFLP